MLLLVAVIWALYSPVLGAFFNADDYSFLRFLYFNYPQLLSGQLWDQWFIGGVVNYTVFRPIGNLFWMLNYAAFGLEPLGYHIVTIVFHVVASIAVYWLTVQLTGNRITSGITAALFAIMPVHAEAVSWVAANYDVLSGMYFLTGLIFYILWRRQSCVRFYIVSLGAFILALSSKETALTFPVVLLVYDLLFHPRSWTRARQIIVSLAGYAPFGILLIIRFIRFGHGYRGLVFAPEGAWYYIDLNLIRVFDPLPEMGSQIRWVALICLIMLLLAFRLRPAVVFGLLWIPITLVPTLVGGVTDRSFYIPSFGIALLLAMIITALLSGRLLGVQLGGASALVLVLAVYSGSLFSLNQAYTRASQAAHAVLQRTQELEPAIPAESRLVFVGVPNSVPEGPPIFGAGFWEAMQILYRNQSLQTYKYSKFPIWLDNLNHTFFFQVDHSRVTERSDLVALLEKRKACASSPQPAVEWDFAGGNAGWEAWNQLSDLKEQNGMLNARSSGSDPFMGSPLMDISALAIGEVEITMRVQAERATFQGSVYWLGEDQREFSPALQVSFAGQADDEFHTYRVDLAKSGMLLLGDRIVRLRLDPVDQPAAIALKTIRIYSFCDPLAEGECPCPE